MGTDQFIVRHRDLAIKYVGAARGVPADEWVEVVDLITGESLDG